MGNSQFGSTADKEKYIAAKKIIQSARDRNRGPLSDIGNQIEQVFGVSTIPVSHRAQAGDSPREKIKLIASSINQFGKTDKKDQQYQERISNLESQINYLKSVIEEMQDKSRCGSPIRSEAAQEQESSSISQSHYREINESRSRVSMTYFQTRQADPQRPFEQNFN